MVSAGSCCASATCPRRLSRYLDYVIHALPLVIDDDDDEGCLVTELLEAS